MATDASGHRIRPPHVERAILDGDKAALSAYGVKGNRSPRRKRKQLTDVEREARRVERNEKARKERQNLKMIALYLAIRWSLEEWLLNIEVEAYRARSWRAQLHADARRHEKELAYVDD